MRVNGRLTKLESFEEPGPVAAADDADEAARSLSPGAFAAWCGDMLRAGVLTREQLRAELHDWPPEIPTAVRDAVEEMLRQLPAEGSQ